MAKKNKSDNKSDDLTKELSEIEKGLPELEKVINENAYHKLLKFWAKMIAITIGIGLFSFFVGFSLATHSSYNLPSSIFTTTTFENSYVVMLGPSVTAIGLVLGFAPVISFFFINSLKDEQGKLDEKKNIDLKRLSKNKVLATAENKSLIEDYYGYLHLIIHNQTSGVLKYVRTFLIVSLISIPVLIEFFMILSPVILFIADILFIIVTVEGVFPIIGICTYKPAIRIRDTFVSTDVPNTIAIKKELEAEE